MNISEFIEQGRAVLGMEFGSTRIKAVLTDDNGKVLATGHHDWENRLQDGIWTYSEKDITGGLRACYASLAADVYDKYDVYITSLAALGFSGMMHGYIALDENDNLLVPFRTWRNTITGEASMKLTSLFGFHIPQRWSIAHLYQAILNGEKHVSGIKYLTTLAGYIHYRLTGNKVMGVGEASGMFPIDSSACDYDRKYMEQFDELITDRHYDWKLRDILPRVLTAGEDAGCLTDDGAALLDASGKLKAGAHLCPPEGDAGTGMTATDAVGVRTGNMSAGTSVFAMVVLDKQLEKLHEELDMVTTPDGSPVAMVHCNNCTSDINAWAGLFMDFAKCMGFKVDTGKVYETLFTKALEGSADCGGIVTCNYFSGEHITGFDEGRPLVVRQPDSTLNIANFMKSNIYSSIASLKIGLDILFKDEKVGLDRITGHGGFFKTPVAGQRIMAAAMNTPVTVMENAGEGGAWGMALLGLYMIHNKEYNSLGDFLHNRIFADVRSTVISPVAEDVRDFDDYMDRYKTTLKVEKAATEGC